MTQKVLKSEVHQPGNCFQKRISNDSPPFLLVKVYLDLFYELFLYAACQTQKRPLQKAFGIIPIPSVINGGDRGILGLGLGLVDNVVKLAGYVHYFCKAILSIYECIHLGLKLIPILC